jgi:uncharacterized membrane protein
VAYLPLMMKRMRLTYLALPLAIVACESRPGVSPGDTPGNLADTAPFSGIAREETVRFTGTEPFWGGEATGSTLTYSTPEDPAGTVIRVERFAGRNGLSLSGELDRSPFDMAITPGECSDGMSDRTYPFTVTLQVRGEQRYGCAWTERNRFTGPENP